MNVVNLLVPERIRCGVHVTSKKRSLEVLSVLLAQTEGGPTDRTIFEHLIGRERLGSTGLGKGVALPHARVDGISETRGALIRLDQPVDFDAIDKQPVDLLFALIVPKHFTDEHLRVLAALAELFSDHAFCERLRSSQSVEEMYQHIVRWQADSPGS
ncbi:MAG: PTS IIA-like nitrogen regulatory protein PtsN [Nitrococcus mobilis]|nr:PTS IIA-like nitrogen regulatory protein PtsN [Nitrococcus mobilis]